VNNLLRILEPLPALAGQPDHLQPTLLALAVNPANGTLVLQKFDDPTIVAERSITLLATTLNQPNAEHTWTQFNATNGQWILLSPHNTSLALSLAACTVAAALNQ
jgi:hypothetical protein